MSYHVTCHVICLVTVCDVCRSVVYSMDVDDEAANPLQQGRFRTIFKDLYNFKGESYVLENLG